MKLAGLTTLDTVASEVSWLCHVSVIFNSLMWPAYAEEVGVVAHWNYIALGGGTA